MEGIDFARKSRGPDRVLPGTGKPKSEFVGRESPPVALERKGLKIVLLAGHLGSLKLGSQVSYRGIGGIAFATPDDPKDGPAKDGTVLLLYDKPRKEWLGWAPKIPIPPESP